MWCSLIVHNIHTDLGLSVTIDHLKLNSTGVSICLADIPDRLWCGLEPECGLDLSTAVVGMSILCITVVVVCSLI